MGLPEDLQLVEVEQAFKELKNDLSVRPIYHQLEHRIEARIFIAFMAYCLQVTLKQYTKELGAARSFPDWILAAQFPHPVRCGLRPSFFRNLMKQNMLSAYWAILWCRNKGLTFVSPCEIVEICPSWTSLRCVRNLQPIAPRRSSIFLSVSRQQKLLEHRFTDFTPEQH
jgi:hypothetical protein